MIENQLQPDLRGMQSYAQPFCQLYHGDCIVEMDKIKEKSVDLILTDLPYGTTACKWDTIIPFDQLWEMVNYLLKPNGTFITTASQPFTSAVVMSNPKKFSYCWVWNKRYPANYPLAKKQPMKIHEDILVFGGNYNPIMTERSIPIKKGANKGAKVFQKGLERKDYEGKIYTHKYPESIILYPTRQEETFTPTQKPTALFEYLIKTYSNENMTIFDPCMGSGTTGVACKNLNRNFIGIEKDEQYFNMAK
jgi:site-specific DNA-methyltransferase (adenine-specific)